MPDERTDWTDKRLDDRLVALDLAIKDVEHQVRAIAPVTAQVAAMAVTVEGVRDAVQRVERAAEQAKIAADNAAAASAKSAKDNRNSVLAFAAPVTVALIGTIAAVVLGGSPT